MNPLRILLVDDSKSARYALRLQLQQHGMKVETSDAAETALERIRESTPDAIFMDYTMPGMSGFEALDILKASPATASIPVIMCTSHEDPEFLAQAKRKGALDVLSKAAAPEKLGQLLDRLGHAGTSAAGVATDIAGAASPQAAESLPGDRLEERVRTLLESFMDDRVEALTGNLMTRIDEQLASGVNTHAQEMEERFREAQSEQAELAMQKLLADRLPMLLQAHLQQGERKLALRARVMSNTRIYLLSASSALIGILSAAMVYHLLR
jgi:CheY-like chemotaxis protein